MRQGKAGWPGWARRAAAVLCLCWVAGSPAAPGEIHEFKQRDGVRLFTDQKRVSSGAVYIGLAFIGMLMVLAVYNDFMRSI